MGKKKNNKFKIIRFVLGVASLTVLGVLTIGVNTQCHELNMDIDDMKRNLTYLRNESSSLDGKITQLYRRDNIEKIAREEINLISAVIEPIEIVLKD